MQWCLEIETYENEIFADRYSLSASWSDGIYQISARPGSSPVLSLPSTLALFFTTPPTKTCTYQIRTYLCQILFLSLSYGNFECIFYYYTYLDPHSFSCPINFFPLSIINVGPIIRCVGLNLNGPDSTGPVFPRTWSWSGVGST